MRRLLVCLALAFTTLACAGGPAIPETAVEPAAAPTTPSGAPAATPAPPVAEAPAPVDVPYYFTRAITPADLDGKTLRELTLLRNTIYARAGNPFRKKWLDAYFRAQPWYRPRAQMDETLLTDLDRQNATAIARYEAGLTRAVLASRLTEVMTRLKEAHTLPDEDLLEIVLLARAGGEDLSQWEQSWEVTFPPRLHELIDVTPLDDPKMLDRQLTVEDLRDLSRRDLRILRNTVYARHGRTFASPTLQLYFGRMEWYKADPAFTEGRLTDLDRRNIGVIQSVETDIGGPMTEHEQQTAESWFDGA